MKIILAQPRGFCAGVVRAIDIVERALAKHGAPVYVRHEIVHNRHVVESLKAKGARFVETLQDVPAGAVTIFSAHGVSREVEERSQVAGASHHRRDVSAGHQGAQSRARVHRPGSGAGVHRSRRTSRSRGNAWVRSTAQVHLVEDEDDVENLPIAVDTPIAYITQTTLSVDDTRGVIAALHRRFSDVVGPDVRDICYATQNRQTAVRELCQVADVIIVVGARNSSNSNRLREIGDEVGIPSYLVADSSEIDPEWVRNAAVVGVTAGASAPEVVVEDVVRALSALAPSEVSVLDGPAETVSFRLPAELRNEPVG